MNPYEPTRKETERERTSVVVVIIVLIILAFVVRYIPAKNDPTYDDPQTMSSNDPRY